MNVALHHAFTETHAPIVESCATMSTYMLFVSSSSTTVNSSSSISSEWNSSCTREHAYLSKHLDQLGLPREE